MMSGSATGTSSKLSPSGHARAPLVTTRIPPLASKAGALLDSLLRNHPFVDGNKRIGVLASFVFIELNGHEVDAENDEVIGLCVDIPSYGTEGDRFERIGVRRPAVRSRPRRVSRADCSERPQT